MCQYHKLKNYVKLINVQTPLRKKNMNEKLTVNVKQNKTGYEGTVQLSGLKETKLTRKDGSTNFPSSSAVKTVARSVGTRLGLEVSYTEPVAKKLAAKPKKAKSTAKVAKSTIGNACSLTSTVAKKTTTKKTAAKSNKSCTNS
jgi:hypothetical protein